MNKPILTPTVSVTRGPLPGSRKLIENGVPFREVPLSGGEPDAALGDAGGRCVSGTAGRHNLGTTW